jgi:hypothetical protein
MCNCGMGSSPAPRTSQPTFQRAQVPPDECPFTLEMVEGWLVQEQCFRNNGYYANTGITLRQLNIYEGTLKSAINYPTNICYFQSQLGDVSSFIMYLASQGICQT